MLLLGELLAFNTLYVAQLGAQPHVVSNEMFAMAGSAWYTLEFCSQLCSQLPLQPADSLRLLGTAKVLFELGQVMLSRLSSKLRSEPEPRWRHSLLAEVAAHLTVFSLLMGEMLRSTADDKLEAAFARTTAKPQVLLPWLLAVTEALQLVCSGPGINAGKPPVARFWVCCALQCPAMGSLLTSFPSLHVTFLMSAGVLYDGLSHYFNILRVLLNGHCWTQHRAELLGRPALRTAVLNCLLHQLLPVVTDHLEAGTAAGINWQAVQPVPLAEATPVYFAALGDQNPGGPMPPAHGEAWLAGALGSPGTRPYGQLHEVAGSVGLLLPHGGMPWQEAAALLPLGVRLVAALPRQRPSAMPPRSFSIMHASVISLLAQCSASLHREAVRQLALPQAPAAQAALASFAATQLIPAAWAVVRLVPYLASTMLAVAADLPATDADVGALVSAASLVMAPLVGAGPHRSLHVSSWEQLSAWAAAADAGMHLLAAVGKTGRSCGAWHTGDLQQLVLRWLGVQGARSAVKWCKAHNLPPVDSLPALASQLWQLHSSVARLVHFSAGGRAACLLLTEGDRQAWPMLQLELLHQAFMLAHHFLLHSRQQLR